MGEAQFRRLLWLIQQMLVGADIEKLVKWAWEDGIITDTGEEIDPRG